MQTLFTNSSSIIKSGGIKGGKVTNEIKADLIPLIWNNTTLLTIGHNQQFIAALCLTALFCNGIPPAEIVYVQVNWIMCRYAAMATKWTVVRAALIIVGFVFGFHLRWYSGQCAQQFCKSCMTFYFLSLSHPMGVALALSGTVNS